MTNRNFVDMSVVLFPLHRCKKGINIIIIIREEGERKIMDYSINTKIVQAGYTPGMEKRRQIPIIQSTTYKYNTREDMGKLF